MSHSSLKNDEKIIFKCDQHTAIISEKLQSFYEDNEFFDTVLIAGNNCVSIQAHRVVLCARSEYLLEIFRGTRSQTPLKENVIELKEIDASLLKLAIDFMYKGFIELSLSTVEGVLRVASFLRLKTLIDGCCEFIEKNIDYRNSLNWLHIANELSLSKLKAKSLECTYIHFERISKETELLMLSEIELKDLLFNDNPYGDFEEEVFLSMVAWINYDKPNRECLVFELLSMVRFWALRPKFIVENRKSVCKTVESYELICSWLQWHLSPETRSNDYQNCALKPRKEHGKPTIVGTLSDGRITFQTFNPEENSWSLEIKSCLPTKTGDPSMIIIDDKLIAIGEFECGGNTNIVKYLDKSTCKWVDLPPMKRGRRISSLVDLDGYLCAFGGDEQPYSIELYNFFTSKWEDIQLFPQPLSGSRIAAHNRVLYILDLIAGLLHSYDVSSKKLTSKTVRKYPIRFFSFIATEGFLYIIGGVDRNANKYVNTIKRYDLSNDSWCEIASLPTARRVLTKVFENKIMICDGRNVEELDINTNKVKTLANVPLESGISLECYLT